MNAAKIAIGMLVGFVCGVLATLIVSNVPLDYEHDPDKMLKLRSACLETSKDVFATWCNNYAEIYSRIETKK